MMRALLVFLRRLQGAFEPKRARDFDAEVLSHLQLHMDENLRLGMTPEQARRDAFLKLGGIEQTKENYRERRTLPALEMFLQDIRFSLRMLRKNVGITAVMVLTLGLGVGANTAIFGLVNGLLLQRLPVPAAEQIVALVIQSSGSPLGALGFSYPQFAEFRDQAKPFCEVFGQALGRVDFTTDARTDLIAISAVSANYFSEFRLQPSLGRLVLPSEAEHPGNPAAVVLGYAFWQKRFSGDPAVVGKQVRVDGRSATIVGVAPKNFRGQFAGFELDAYLPLSTQFPERSAHGFWNSRDSHMMLSLGRLKSGITPAQAQIRFDVISQRLAGQYPATDKDLRVRVMDERLSRPIPYANNAFLMMSGLFLILGSLVLLLACTNIANILMARAFSRRREMAIRAALGGARFRLVRQMLTETVLTALLGGLAGVLLGAWFTHLLRMIHVSGFPLRLDFGFDWRVFAYALLAVLFTALFAGLSPALRATSSDVNVVLHQSARHGGSQGKPHRVRGDLMVAQVAGSLTLLVVAGLFVRSLQAVQHVDLGFEPNQLLNVHLDPSLDSFNETRAEEFYRALEARTRALPGVQSASLAVSVPLGYSDGRHSVHIEGRPVALGQPAPAVLFNCVDPAYFTTLRMPILSGRAFNEGDDKSSPHVAIVNQTMARRFWPQENPIGKRFSIVGAAGPFLEVVGLAQDGKYRNVAEDAEPYFYLPLAQNFAFGRVLQIRSARAADSLTAEVQREVLALGAGAAIEDVQTMKQALNGALGYFLFRLGASLAAGMGGLGLLLAVVGVYGVVSYAATQRTQELGIRMALGASRSQILTLLLRQGAQLVAVGLLVGLAGAWALARAMRYMLVGISPNDPLTYCSVAALLSTVTLLACWIPAHRAMRVDPMVALRYE